VFDEHVTCYQQKPLALDFKEKKIKNRMTVKHTQRKKKTKKQNNMKSPKDKHLQQKKQKKRKIKAL
jgi:hypothetical protein